MEAAERFTDLERYANEMNKLEHEGDRITRELTRLIDRSLVTPLDREDIHALIQAIDDVVDITEGVLERIVLYKISEKRKEFPILASELVLAAEAIAQAVSILDKPKLYEREMQTHFDKIIQAEKRGDKAYRAGLAEIFNGAGENVLNAIKWREVLEHLEDALDACERVCDIIQGITIKGG
jgi:predicted phosphate transport protein (TIGR00153 family)